jgi:hypothetical protein
MGAMRRTPGCAVATNFYISGIAEPIFRGIENHY